ncbi:hypothetical protein [Desulfovibrio sp. DV]|uniref:hypothetical protein n=1 Tax=Desulfovibrio sp. DV TaxID=1844708 RepID=UPI0020C9A4F4|nr:hypothetical protein [Desulfovibrio sp. DV]
MRVLGWIFSIFLHLTVVLASLLFVNIEPVKFQLNVPVYEVDLVSLAPPGLPPGEAGLPLGPKGPGDRPEPGPPEPAGGPGEAAKAEETLPEPAEAPATPAKPIPPEPVAGRARAAPSQALRTRTEEARTQARTGAQGQAYSHGTGQA